MSGACCGLGFNSVYVGSGSFATDPAGPARHLMVRFDSKERRRISL